MSWLLKHPKALYWWADVVALCPGNLCCGVPLLFMDLLDFNMGEQTEAVAAFSFSYFLISCCSMFFHYFHNPLFSFPCHLVTSIAPILPSLKLLLFPARICTCNIFYKCRLIDLLAQVTLAEMPTALPFTGGNCRFLFPLRVIQMEV